MLSKIIFGYEPQEEKTLLDFVKKHSIGGIILYTKNIHKNINIFLRELKENSRNENLIIAVDQEGGNVRRFKDEDIFFMGARDASHLQNPIQYGVDVEFMAKKLKQIGINLILAPVLDIVYYENNILYQRSYGSIESIINFGFSFYSAIRKYGIKACLKHFFGYGLLENIDPHKSTFKIGEIEIDNILKPFIWFIDKGYTDFIMSAHVEYEGEIITYSKNWLHNFLKNKLKFNGFLITDDLHMKAAGNFPLKIKVNKALDAGHDYCIVSGSFVKNLNLL